MFRTIRGIVDSRISGENTISAIQKLYNTTSKINLGDEPHIRLIKTAYSRLTAQNMILRKGDTDVEIMVRSYTLSAVPACLPEGHNSRLLALHLLRMERMDVWGRFPEFQAEEARLLRSLEREVVQGETLLNIYKRHNPLLQIVDLDDDKAGYSVLCCILAELEYLFAAQLEIPTAQRVGMEREFWEGRAVQGQVLQQAAAQKKDHNEVNQGSPRPAPDELTMAGWERDEEANAVGRHNAVYEAFAEKNDRSSGLFINPNKHDFAWTSAPNDLSDVAQSQPNKTTKLTLEEIDRTARMVIEYDEATAAAWAELQHLPLEFKDLFIKEIGSKPDRDINALVAELRESYLNLMRPYDDEAANDGLEQTRTISPDAEAEFREVYALLGNRVTVVELLNRIEEKFGLSDATKVRWEAERLEQERLEKERLEHERLEQERLEKERLEKERLEHERLEKERLEKERLEQERLEQERLEQERLEQERLEKERLEQERLEQERLEKERLEKERVESNRRELALLKKESLERRQRNQEKREQERRERAQQTHKGAVKRQSFFLDILSFFLLDVRGWVLITLLCMIVFALSF